jgi:hypothetical protein
MPGTSVAFTSLARLKEELSVSKQFPFSTWNFFFSTGI